MARNDPYYKRNRPHICSFFVKGTCNRGKECPYRYIHHLSSGSPPSDSPSDRHEMPEDNGLQKQNIKDRYHGRNDPVAKKLLTSYAASKGLEPPEDTSIQSLFLTTLPANATEEAVRSHVIHSLPFLSPDDIRSVVHVAKSRCAFVNFKSRAAAERAAEAWAAGLDMEGQVVGVKWRKSRTQAAGAA
jgi:pre-mRNA-splicing factor RBM22/SLT11